MREMNAAAAAAETAASLKSLKQNNNKNLFFLPRYFLSCSAGKWTTTGFLHKRCTAAVCISFLYDETLSIVFPEKRHTSEKSPLTAETRLKAV